MKITENELFNVVKPLPEGCIKDENCIPFLKKELSLTFIDWNKIKFSSLSNIKATRDKGSKILLNYAYDKRLNAIYKDIFSFAEKVMDFFAVATPDFSAYTNMEPCQIIENIRHGLWVGAWLQYLGIKIIPTITWADERTYDVCFNHVEEGSIVTISTVGVMQYKDLFIKGFNEMMKRIKPKLVIVRGKPINGMFGNFIFVDFCETFETKNYYEQISLFDMDKIQILKKEEF